MANQYANKVVIGEDTIVDLSNDTVTPERLAAGYTAHDASGAPITGTCVNLPIPPYAYDYEPGYTNQGTFIYQDSTNNHTDVYEVTAGHYYVIALGATVGTRFRAALLPSNPVGAGQDVKGTTVVNKNNPVAYERITFGATDDGYFVVTKDNASTTGLKSYLFDITPDL